VSIAAFVTYLRLCFVFYFLVRHGVSKLMVNTHCWLLEGMSNKQVRANSDQEALKHPIRQQRNIERKKKVTFRGVKPVVFVTMTKRVHGCGCYA